MVARAARCGGCLICRVPPGPPQDHTQNRKVDDRYKDIEPASRSKQGSGNDNQRALLCAHMLTCNNLCPGASLYILTPLLRNQQFTRKLVRIDKLSFLDTNYCNTWWDSRFGVKIEHSFTERAKRWGVPKTDPSYS